MSATDNRIYRVVATPGSPEVTLEPAWEQGARAGLPPGLTQALPLTLGGSVFLLGYDKASDRASVYELTAGAPSIVPGKAPELVGGPWDLLDVFTLGDEPYLVAYSAQRGIFNFYHVKPDWTLSPPYSVVQTRMTSAVGFTTLKAFTSIRSQYLFGYNAETGTVGVWSVTVRPTSIEARPPLHAANSWYWQWARGWTRFAFFQLGGANFFLKTNVVKLNVNIDHLQDDPADGSVEVGTHLESQLPDAIAIDLVAPLLSAHGDVHFMTYVAKSGIAKVYRVHGDCRGWTQVGAGTTPSGSTHLAPYRIGDDVYVLFYSSVPTSIPRPKRRASRSTE